MIVALAQQIKEKWTEDEKEMNEIMWKLQETAFAAQKEEKLKHKQEIADKITQYEKSLEQLKKQTINDHI